MEPAKVQATEPVKAKPLDPVKVQPREPARAQPPEAMKAQALEPCRVQPSEATKKQQYEAIKTQPLETTKAQPSKVTKVQLPGTTITQPPKTIVQQPPGFTKSRVPETSKSQLPGLTAPTNINGGLVEVKMLAKSKESEQITKVQKATTENSTETDCTTRSLASCKEKQNYDDTIMLVDDSKCISGSNRTNGNREGIPTSAVPLEIKNSINENVQKSKIVTNSTEDNTTCYDSRGDGTLCKETGVFLCKTTKPVSDEMTLDASTFTSGYQKLQGIIEMKMTSNDSNEEHHNNPDKENVMNEICSDTSAARNSIFSSLESLKSSLDAFTAFDKIANEVILSTVMSLENVLRKATSIYGDTQNDLVGGPQTIHAINKADDHSSDGNINKVIEGCNMIDGQNQVVGLRVGDCSAKSQPSNSRCQAACKGVTQKKIGLFVKLFLCYTAIICLVS